MHQQKVAALLVEAGSTLDYFTGVDWWLSERVTAAGQFRRVGKLSS